MICIERTRVRFRETKRRDESNRATVSDTCSRMVRRPRRCGAARRDVAPYRACNMHVSIRALSNISFRSIYPNALSCRLSRCELYSISHFPSVCRRRARHKQTRRCKKVSVPRTYRITMTRKKRSGQGRFRAHSLSDPCARTWSFQQVHRRSLVCVMFDSPTWRVNNYSTD